MVSISPSYPETSPVFCLSLQLDSDTETVETSEMMRDLEKEVNMGWKEQGEDDGSLLLVMLHRLLVLLDVMLEVRSSMQEGEGGNTNTNFTKSQVFFDTVKGKMRRLPLQYNGGQQLFQQK